VDGSRDTERACPVADRRAADDPAAVLERTGLAATRTLPPTVPDDPRSSDAAVSTVTLPRTVAPLSSQNWSGGTTTLSYVPL
jgi:hypothetical protein